MTLDDGSTDVLDLHVSQVQEAPRRRLRTGWVLGGGLALVVAVAGAGMAAVVRSSAPTSPPSSAPAPSTAAGAAPASTGGAGTGQSPRPVLAQAALEQAGRSAGLLTVGTGTPVTGLAPPVVNFHSCGADGAQIQYLPVEIRNPLGGMAAAVTVTPGPTTPPAIGRLGFFFGSRNGDAVPCRSSAAWPTTDTFEAVNGTQLITGYVVLDQAITTATPQGRPDVLSSLQLTISKLRQFDDHDVPRPLRVGTPTVGRLCPGDPTAVCAPLG